MRATVSNEYPELRAAEHAKKIKENFNQLCAADRLSYQQKAEQDRQHYLNSLD